MTSAAQVALWSIGYELDALNPEEKKELRKWRSLSKHNESIFQELISPEFRKALFEEYLKRNNLTADEYWAFSPDKRTKKNPRKSITTSSTEINSKKSTTWITKTCSSFLKPFYDKNRKNRVAYDFSHHP